MKVCHIWIVRNLHQVRTSLTIWQLIWTYWYHFSMTSKWIFSITKYYDLWKVLSTNSFSKKFLFCVAFSFSINCKRRCRWCWWVWCILTIKDLWPSFNKICSKLHEPFTKQREVCLFNRYHISRSITTSDSKLLWKIQELLGYNGIDQTVLFILFFGRTISAKNSLKQEWSELFWILSTLFWQQE